MNAIDAIRRNRSLLIGLGIAVVLVLLLLGRYEPRVAANVVLSGLTLGALYFLVASGLSLIFGLMDVLNFAHGLLFMAGAYFGYTLYANPRMILNMLPFALALGGGALIGASIAGPLAARLKSPPVRRIAALGLYTLAGVLAIAGLQNFDLLALAATGVTAAGGAIPTELAQEPTAAFAARLAVLTMAGIALGGALRRQTAAGRLSSVVGLLVIGLAFVLALLRTPGEQFILGLSSDARFVLALFMGAGGGAALGGMIEWGLIRPLYARPIYQVLLTLGLVFVGTEVIKSVWGPAGFYMDIPQFFNTRGGECPSPDVFAWLRDHCASINVVGRPFPSYRLFIIAVGLAMFMAIAALLRRTRLGIIIRAGVQDSEMVQALGINVRRVFTLVFALGAGLAALGGVAAAPFVGVNPGLGQEFLIQAFIAVVIGGMGSYPGAALGALLVGLARAFGDQLVLSGVQVAGMAEAVKLSPSIARASTVLIMALVLLVRPAGLLGKKE